MKKIIVVLLLGLIASSTFLNAQNLAPASVSTAYIRPATGPSQRPELTRFDLDFPGGTPQDLVRAIERAHGKPLNAIVPPEYDKMPIPPLKMKSVNVAELFNALLLATTKTRFFRNGSYSSTAYGFKTENAENFNENSIWFFWVQDPPTTQDYNICRFFQLDKFLNTYKVEDIITAIDTGWKMLGDSSPPKLSFHKDTKLLIAVGNPEKLQLIDNVLSQLTVKPASSPGLPSAPSQSGEPVHQP